MNQLFEAAEKCGLSVTDYTPAGGETYQQFLMRVKEFYTDLIR